MAQIQNGFFFLISADLTFITAKIGVDGWNPLKTNRITG